MKTKVLNSTKNAIDDIHDGATIMIGGFAGRGVPSNILMAVRDMGVKNLTMITCVASGGWKNPSDVDMLIENGQVIRIITAYPVFGSTKRVSFAEQKVSEGKCTVEVVPMGTLIERIRAGGAGIGGFYTPVGIGTEVANGKEVKHFNGQDMLLEHALKADFSLVKSYIADHIGNLKYRMSARNYNPIVAMAGRTTIVETENLVPTGEIDPNDVHTPGIFVDRIVHISKR